MDTEAQNQNTVPTIENQELPSSPPVPTQPKSNSGIVILFTILVLILLGSTGYLYYQNMQLKKMVTAQQAQISPAPSSATITTNTSPIISPPATGWLTYADNQNGFKFDYSPTYNVVADSSSSATCDGLTNDNSSCLALNINTNVGGNGYVPEAIFYLIKGINKINISGQVDGIKFNSQKSMWVDENPGGETELPTWAYTKSDNNVIKTSIGGSEASSNSYIIPDYKNDKVAIFLIPQSFRLRCDLMQGQEQTACNSFYKSVINQYNNGQATEDTWLPDIYMQSLYPNIESVITSFSFTNE
jgi:hypothetical protein